MDTPLSKCFPAYCCAELPGFEEAWLKSSKTACVQLLQLGFLVAADGAESPVEGWDGMGWLVTVTVSSGALQELSLLIELCWRKPKCLWCLQLPAACYIGSRSKSKVGKKLMCCIFHGSW